MYMYVYRTGQKMQNTYTKIQDPSKKTKMLPTYMTQEISCNICFTTHGLQITHLLPSFTNNDPTIEEEDYILLLTIIN